MERIILHVDVNNAFLSWSAVWLLKNGYEKDIRNRYAIIAGDETQRRGIVLAKSNLCKKKGVKTAEAIIQLEKSVLIQRFILLDMMYIKSFQI